MTLCYLIGLFRIKIADSAQLRCIQWSPDLVRGWGLGTDYVTWEMSGGEPRNEPKISTNEK